MDAVTLAMVQQLVAAVHPLRVVVFGSRARGDARVDSDLDVLVEVADHVDPVACHAAIRKALRPRLAALDCIVATTSQMEQCRREFPQHIITTALLEGVTAHADAA